jgi:purine-binding chemotaxis protein CheW
VDRATPLLVFTVDDQRYAVRLTAIERVVRMVEITPLPQAPGCVIGVIDVAGSIVPVISLRKRMGKADRLVHLNDLLVIATSGSRTLALVVDRVEGLISPPAGDVAQSHALGPVGELEGVARGEDGLLLIHDMHRFLAPGEAEAMDAALCGREKNAAEEVA